MAGDGDLVEVIEPGPAEGAVGHREAGGLDDVRCQPQTGASAQNRTGILWNVGLKKGNLHRPACRFSSAAQAKTL